jgi:proline iminopeptidase
MMSRAAETRIIPISAGHHVWTGQVVEGPIKLLLLHGGPGGTYEEFENFPEYLLPHGAELYFYDQLGSYHSEQPDNPSLWKVERIREEVEEGRRIPYSRVALVDNGSHLSQSDDPASYFPPLIEFLTGL